MRRILLVVVPVVAAAGSGCTAPEATTPAATTLAAPTPDDSPGNGGPSLPVPRSSFKPSRPSPTIEIPPPIE